jgi:hypothetical protein
MSENNSHVWAFDLGKGSIGEAVREGNTFPHNESLLIPAELARRGPAAVSGSPANKYRAMKTREAPLRGEKSKLRLDVHAHAFDSKAPLRGEKSKRHILRKRNSTPF